MTSSYTTNKLIEKPANGDYVNTWATPVNNDWDIIDTAFGGTTNINAVPDSGTVTLTVAQYRPPIIIISGAITANINYQLPSGKGGFWYIFNNTTYTGGPYAIVFSSAGGGSTVTLAQGKVTAVISDGTNVLRADTNPPEAAGSTTQVQFNTAGVLDASANLTWGAYSATFTGTIAASSATLITTSVTGTIRIGMTLGTITGGGGFSPPVTILAQVSGTTGGAGSYTISQTNTGGSGATVGSASFSALAASNVIGNLTGNAATATSTTVATTATYASTITGTALAIGYLQLPQNSQTTSYTAVVGDVGKHIYTTANVTLNPSVFSAGDAFVIVNGNTATTSITVIAGTGVVLRIAGTTTSGTPRTIAPNGMVSVLCVVGGTVPTFLLSGAGLS